MVPKLVTLSDLERRNGSYFAFGADYVKVVEDIDPYCLQQKSSPKNLVFSDITHGITENEGINNRHPL